MPQSRTVKVSPSLLSADPLKFFEEIRSVEEAGADWHHVDVMDGHFVPNLTYGLPFVAAVKKMSALPLDVHIMITNPDEMARKYVEAGADYLTFHIEASANALQLAQEINRLGCKAGVAISPGTDMETLRPVLKDISVVNVMSVYPGYSGQKFIEESVNRVKKLHSMLVDLNLENKVLIEVDGGVNEKTGKQVVDAGARVLVAGNYVYLAEDRSAAVNNLKSTGK